MVFSLPNNYVRKGGEVKAKFLDSCHTKTLDDGIVIYFIRSVTNITAEADLVSAMMDWRKLLCR
jgi:hypothetical protein